MRAIILAAGRGLRLQQTEENHTPKCLLPFGGMSLLERHFCMLRAFGVEEVVLTLGFRHDDVTAELDRLNWSRRPRIVQNPHFELGSVLTVHTAAAAMTAGGEVLLMDADVLYDERIMRALLHAAGAKRLCELVAEYVAPDRSHMPQEQAVRALIREQSQTIEVVDVSGLPGIEIDFPVDVTRAEREVLPRLHPLSGVFMPQYHSNVPQCCY